MPTLSVYRNGTLEWRGPITDYTLRIGRSPENDLVLEDPTKGVSRFHAELRWEHDHYIIADLGSQNGTWVAGQRIETAPLIEGAQVALGPYRLVLEPEPAGDGEEVTIAPLPVSRRGASVAPPAEEMHEAAEPAMDPHQAATMLPQAVSADGLVPPLPPADPLPPAFAPSTVTLPPADPPASSTSPGATPPPPRAAAPVVPSPAKAGATVGAKPAAASPMTLVAVAAAAVVLLLAVGGARLLLLRRASPVAVDRGTPPIEAPATQLRDALASARQAIAAGQLETARQQVEVALALDPANAAAAELRRQIDAAPVAPPAEPAVEAVGTAPEAEPPAEPPPAAAVAAPALATDPGTGLAQQKRESPRAFARRVADAKKLATDVQEAIRASRVTESRGLLAQLASAAPRHPRLPSLTEGFHTLEAREHTRAAQAAYEDGKRLQQSGTEADLVGARAAYRKAGSLQPGLADAELQQVQARLADLGKVALSNARNFQNFKRRDQAIEQYKRALLLLGDCADCDKALKDLQQP